jgi:hypothetical protein
MKIIVVNDKIVKIKTKAKGNPAVPSMARRFVGVPTAYNRTVYAPLPPVAAGLRLARSIAALIPTPASTHIFAVAGTLRVPLSRTKNRRKQPERYAKCALKWL